MISKKWQQLLGPISKIYLRLGKRHYEHLLSEIGHCISDKDNHRLTAQYTKEEI